MTEPFSYPFSFQRDATAGGLQERYVDLEAGAESSDTVSLAGRVMSKRGHGKIAFADLRDTSGRVQLMAQEADLGEGLGGFDAIGVGDIVGARGTPVRTRRGELSVRLTEVVILAPCLRPMPEKWHGVTDVETRYRQRYLDLLVNPEAEVAVRARSAANDAIRSFFRERDFLEVETPLLQSVASGAVARPFVTHHNALDIDLFLRVAPELFLKRLLIGGFERVYELNRSFRNEGVSTRHNPEFTMLEAYEAFVDFNQTMDLVEDLVRAIAGAVVATLGQEEPVLDLTAPFERITMFDAIERATGKDLTDIWASEDISKLTEAAGELGAGINPSWPPGKILATIYEDVAEKKISAPTWIAGFPRDISPLARSHRSIPRFTEHADLVISGVEIAPVYSELNDPDEQRDRFKGQSEARAAGEEETLLPDEDFLDALAYGMPPAGGFGLGVDRLLMILLGVDSIREVILFPTLRPQDPAGSAGGQSEQDPAGSAGGQKDPDEQAPTS